MAMRVLDLVRAILRGPFSGIGKPEPLEYLTPGAWSRRLTQEHRIVYLVRMSGSISCRRDTTMAEAPGLRRRRPWSATVRVGRRRRSVGLQTRSPACACGPGAPWSKPCRLFVGVKAQILAQKGQYSVKSPRNQRSVIPSL